MPRCLQICDCCGDAKDPSTQERDCGCLLCECCWEGVNVDEPTCNHGTNCKEYPCHTTSG